jgi:hypothetical protein
MARGKATYGVYRLIRMWMESLLDVALQDRVQAWRVCQAEDTKANRAE